MPRNLAPGAELLLRGLPSEVLARVADGDPLDLCSRVADCLERRCLLLDPDRLLLLAMADVARVASRWGGRPALGKWLDERVEFAVDQMLIEEARAYARIQVEHQSKGRGPDLVKEADLSYDGLPPVDDEIDGLNIAELLALAPAGDSRLPVLESLARPLGLSPAGLRCACAAFNARPELERQAFDRLVLCRDSLDELAQRLGNSASLIGRRARRALEAILEAVASQPGACIPTEASMPPKTIDS